MYDTFERDPRHPIVDHFSTNPVRSLFHSATFQAGLFLALHLVLGLTMNMSSAFSTIHAVATVLLGLWWAMTNGPLERIAWVGAYIVGAEVLWRMTDARIFWEAGKYAVILIFFVALLRTRSLKVPHLPLYAFVLLLPSSILTIDALGIWQGREQISFNLAASFALFVCAWFFSHTRLSKAQLQHLFIALMAPVLSIASITLSSILSRTDIVWMNDSNFQASGGFGPNQVSTALGLGLLIIWLFILISDRIRIGHLGLTFIGLWFLAQGLLTFSRGGVINGIIPALIATASLLIHRQTRRSHAFITLIIIIALVTFLLLPQLNDFTEGMLGTRFSDLNLTNRDAITQSNIQIFFDNPLYGVGPGMAKRHITLHAAAHTEYSRMLAEHGLMGVLSLALILLMSWRNYLRTAAYPLARVVVTAVLVWGLLYMMHSATRLVAIAFFLGLPFTRPAIDVGKERTSG